MKKFASGAETLFNRAKQYTEEKLGQAEKTEYEPEFERLLDTAEKTRTWTEKLVKQTEALLQPNPTLRMEQFINEKMAAAPAARQSEIDAFGQNLIEAGNDLGPSSSYGSALVKCGQMQQKLAEAERQFVQSSITNFLLPLKAFLDGDMKIIQKERKSLETIRLDLDAAKSKYKRGKTENKEADDPAVAKVENDLRVAQEQFDRQVEVTKLLLEGIASSHGHHLHSLNEFVTGQATYYAQCNHYMTDLQKQLGSVSTHSVEAE